MGKGHGLPTAAVAAILFFFFLPWISVSCGGSQVATFSGFELAAGKELNLGFSTERIEGDALMFVVPIAAIIAGAALWMGSNGDASSATVRKTLIASTIAGLGILAAKWFAMQENATSGISVSGEVGLWGTIGAWILLFYSAIVMESHDGVYERSNYGAPDRRGSTSRGTIECSHVNEDMYFCSRCGVRLSMGGLAKEECKHFDERGDYCRACGRRLTMPV